MESQLIWSFGIGAALTVLAFLVYFFAKQNIFFTIVREGTAKAILRLGKMHRIVFVYQGFFLDTHGMVRKDEEGNKIGTEEDVDLSKIFTSDELEKAFRDKDEGYLAFQSKDGKEEKVLIYRIKCAALPFHIGGLFWVGIPFLYSVYEYKFHWTSFEQEEEGGKLTQKTRFHDEEIDYILLQDEVYYTFVREAETDGMIPVDVDLLLTIRIVNPYKALFRVQNWLEMTVNILMPALRSYIGRRKFEELVKERKESVEREADDLLMESKISSYLVERYGVRLKKVGMPRIDPSGTRKEEYEKAAVKGWLAEKEKASILVLADAEMERMKKVYGMTKDFGDLGLFLKMNETLQKVGEGPSNLVIFPLGDVKDILRGLIGGRKEEKA